MTYVTLPLDSSHNKKDFVCGHLLLDSYLHTQAKQDVKKKLSTCFVIADDGQNVIGYYTLSSSSIPQSMVPVEIQRKMPPSYRDLPVTLLGRLAVNNTSKGRGLGAKLLIDALKRSFDASINSIGSIAVVVDPIDEMAVKFYEKYGFVTLLDSEKMFLPMTTIAQLFK